MGAEEGERGTEESRGGEAEDHLLSSGKGGKSRHEWTGREPSSSCLWRSQRPCLLSIPLPQSHAALRPSTLGVFPQSLGILGWLGGSGRPGEVLIGFSQMRFWPALSSCKSQEEMVKGPGVEAGKTREQFTQMGLLVGNWTTGPGAEHPASGTQASSVLASSPRWLCLGPSEIIAHFCGNALH